MADGGRSLPVLGQDGAEGEGEDQDESPPREGSAGNRQMTPLQAELLEDGALPDPDEIGRAMLRPDLAPGAGYGESGPRPLEGPGGPASGEDRRSGGAGGAGGDGPPVPVFQWEVDPRSEELPVEEAQAEGDGWEYRMWWQEHPSGLVYASLQALRAEPEEAGGSARAHPVGRAVAVNLVYDTEREAVAAVYGTARDFRPFVAAFWEAYRDGAEPEDAAPAPDGAAGDEDDSNGTETG